MEFPSLSSIHPGLTLFVRTRATLATRLNELALSNADGLLGDDEYRILRATIFEQVASGQPTENKYGHVPGTEMADERMVERGELLFRFASVFLDSFSLA